MKFLSLFFFVSLNVVSYANIYQIGASKPYTSPNALYTAGVVQDGDTIEIDAEVYTGQASLAAWGQNNLLIKGVGGKPHLEANGQYIMGKGIWVCIGNNITVENIEFSGTTVPDKNGAGIRLDGIGLTVRNCYFHDNENGILTSNPYDGDILVEFSEFARNGYGDGYSHNLYIGRVNSLTFRFNYSHHTNVGHNLKSRAKENVILYNRIMDEETGNSSRLVDIPNGGFSIVMGNSFMQGEYAENNNLLGYGLEGLSNDAPHEIYVINNTFVNKRTSSCLFVSIEGGTSVATVANNIFAGGGEIINGPFTIQNTNYVDSSIANLEFLDEPNFDYHLTETSPAIDYGEIQSSVNGHSLTPDSTYEHPTNFGLRTVQNTIIDAGAYEYEQPLSIVNKNHDSFSVFPNPTSGILFIQMNDNQLDQIIVYDASGRIVIAKHQVNSIDVSQFDKGIYYLEIHKRGGEHLLDSFIKR